MSPASFVELVRRSQLVSASELDTVLATANKESPPSSVDLADRLVKSGKLTKFQAKLLLQGKGRGFILRDKYKILDQIGAGGMGNVFLCEHVVLKRRVAVKTLNASQLNDPSAVERFLREARAVAALDDPNIVRVYDVEQEGPTPLMIMEYVEGRPLDKEAKEPLPVHLACRYVSQAAMGLQHAAEVGVVHRDIKPANLLLDKSGTVKILDMGLARFRSPEASDELTKKFDGDSVLGTADYLAPEQAVDSTSVDTRADIYALGATLFYLLTGKPPFEAPTVAEKLLAHQMKPVPPLKKYRDDVPAGLENVLRTMMAKKPEDRFQHPVEVVEALRPWVNESGRLKNQLVDGMGNTFSDLSDGTPWPAKRPTARIASAKKRKRAASKNKVWLTIGIGIVLLAAVALIAALSRDKNQPVPVASRREEPAPEVNREPLTKKIAPPAEAKKGEPPKVQAKKGDGLVAITPEEAGKHVGESAVLRFEVRGTGYPKSRNVVFLNSNSNYKDPENFTVVLSRSAGEKLFPGKSFDQLDVEFRSKRVEVGGRITEFGGRPQIEVNDPAQLKILE